MSMAPEWTPAPGHYEVKSDFNKIMSTKTVGEVAEDGTEEQKIVTYAPWNQKGYR